MKKFAIPFLSFILIIVIIGFVAWFNLPNIVEHVLSKEFTVPVTVGNIEIAKNYFKINDFNVGMPKGSHTKSSFFTKEFDIKAYLKNIKKEKITIESLTLNNNIISIEFYNDSGTDNNWSRILKTPTKSKKPSQKKYLIKKTTLNNITFVLIKKNGQKQTFPTIEKLEFYNISDETGFPIDELEKALANLILKSIFQKFNLLHLLQEVPPVQIIQKVIPIFFK